MQAASVTAQLTAAVHDRAACLHAFTAYVHDPLAWRDDDRINAVDAIVAAASAWPKDAQLCGGACCALFHASANATLAAVPVDAAVAIIRCHVGDAMVVAAALRLLASHTTSSRIMEALPSTATAVAEAMRRHPRDDNVSYFGARIIIAYNSIDPSNIAMEFGSFRLEDVKVASLTAAVSSRVLNFHVGELTWQDHVADRLNPRFR
ncbi:hypothetical protein OAO87_00365 [bacterium]|nr:hypothetical protein [bacterium]